MNVITTEAIDTLWVIACAGLVFLMQAGFLCLESGITRTKNTINVAMKNFADTTLAIIGFWLIGHALMTAPSVGGLLGFGDTKPIGANQPYNTAVFLLQAAYCGTVASIVSGAIAERAKFSTYLIITIVISVCIYPLAAHWAWNVGENGHPSGWLHQLGFVDWAGSGVVHMIGGCAALAGIIVIGPRDGRFNNDSKHPAEFTNFNLPFTMLGIFLFLVGWVGFNGGANLGFDAQTPSVILNTVIAACGGGVSGSLVSYAFHRKIKVMPTLIGTLTGLVSITASAHAISVEISFLIAFIGGIIGIAADRLLVHLKIDDAVGAVPVHLFGGAWGLLSFAIFSDPAHLQAPSRLDQVLAQFTGLIAFLFLGFVVVYLLLLIIHRVVGLRVSLDDERLGLNTTEHAAYSEMSSLLTIMDERVSNEDDAIRVPIDPFSEVGQIAQHYNKVVREQEELNVTLEMRVEERTIELATVNQDMTREIQDRENAERELETALYAAESANRTKSSFLANMSHELRTPLNSILGFTEVIDRQMFGKLENKQYEEYIKIIHSSGSHLLSLINEILDLSKVEADAMELNESTANLPELIAMSLELVTSTADSKNITVTSTVPSDAPDLHCDSLRVKQILVNLVGNAVKFTPIGGVVEITAHVDNNNSISLVVSDNGIGMQQIEVDRLFEPFTQVEDPMTRNFQGTGLGLSLVRSLANLHDATVEVSSEPNVGTQATVKFPPERTIHRKHDISS